MKNRFSTVGRSLLGAMCLLSVCGLTYSCSDDYDLDETMPGFLGGSIYDELRSGKSGQFTTVVKLIDDLGYKDVLSKTGSKTLFVADDEAYNKFFANQTVFVKGGVAGDYVRKYEELESAQKSLLLYGAMLNNADVLEMLPYSSGGGSLTMRRATTLSALDSIKVWNWSELPVNLNEQPANETKDHNFWAKYNKRSDADGKKMLLAVDGTSPMMLHFVEEQMKEKNVQRSDVSFVLSQDNDPWEDAPAAGEGDGGPVQGGRTYIYDARVVKQDITCMNGYINVLDKVLITPQNMAEVIRTTPELSLFSAMLDRFSAPFYSRTLTQRYATTHDLTQYNDSVFEKRYFAARSQNGGALDTDPDGKGMGNFPLLAYDPGWNEYAVSNTIGKEQDMAAMFVPSNTAMQDYFLRGGGKQLLEAYGKVPVDQINEGNLLENLYQVPLDIMQALINNLMKDSFNESVPSKYRTIPNDAQDQMFQTTSYTSVDDYKSIFSKRLVANNGVVYVMNTVIAPADYASVIAPALFSDNSQVVNAIVRADDNFIDGDKYNQAPLQMYYSTYLKAMQSYFSFFVPTDDVLKTTGYVDPLSLALGSKQSKYYRYWRYTYRTATDQKIPVNALAYRYDPTKGQSAADIPQNSVTSIGGYQSSPSDNLGSSTGAVKKALLLDLIDQHIIVHDERNGGTDGFRSERKYYTSRGGAPVILMQRGHNALDEGMVVEGGYQWQLNHDQYPANDVQCTVTKGYDQTGGYDDQGRKGYGNGMTYFIDRPIQPTTLSVQRVLTDDESHFGAFLALCDNEFSEETLKLAGFKKRINSNTGKEEELEGNDWANERRKYVILTNNGVNPAAGEKLVRFLNNFRYTLYVPTNQAVNNAYALGLKTQDQIADWIEQHKGYDKEVINPETNEKETVHVDELTPENQAKAQAMITMLINFIRYHFQDQAFYVDNVVDNDFAGYQTSCMDKRADGTLSYISINVKQDRQKITLRDNAGNPEVHVMEPYNLLARDVDYETGFDGAYIFYKGFRNSSFVAIHQVDAALNFVKESQWKNDYKGRFDGAWADAATAKAFTAKYKIRN